MRSPRTGILLLAVVAAVGVYAGYRIYCALLPDETRIRNRFAEMVEALNDGGIGAVADGLAEEFRDLTTGFDRNQLLAILRYAVLRERDPSTRRFALRAEILDEPVPVELEGDTARASFRLRVQRARGGEWTDSREGRVEAKLRNGDHGWQVVEVQHTWNRGSGRRWRW